MIKEMLIDPWMNWSNCDWVERVMSFFFWVLILILFILVLAFFNWIYDSTINKVEAWNESVGTVTENKHTNGYFISTWISTGNGGGYPIMTWYPPTNHIVCTSDIGDGKIYKYELSVNDPLPIGVLVLSKYGFHRINKQIEFRWR